MDIKTAFNSISDRVEAVLVEQGFTKEKVSGNDNEMVSLFTSDAVAYSVVYLKDKMHMVFRSCTMTEDGPDNEWKDLATWLFDPAVDTQKEATSIANDFVENCSSVVALKRVKNTKKKKKKEDGNGNADPLFLAKRFVTFFPELKDEIKREEDCYYPFRGVTFTRASIVPRVCDYVKTCNKNNLEKLCNVLNAQYVNGDADTRSIITIVILNSMPLDKYEQINEYLSPELQKAWKYAIKFKDKKVKPAKPKKKKVSMAERLQAQQNG